MSPAAPGSSRAATDELLAGLQAGRWRPAAWARFLLASGRRSARQAARHPRALAEVTVLHAALALAAGGQGRRWVAASWAMTATHLGMLEDRSSLGAAGLVTLLRANLPALGPRAARHPALLRWLPALALASDLADGRIARRTGTVTAFGAQADSLADAAFWTWFTLHHELSRPVRFLALGAWAAPVVVVTCASLAQGRMTDPPRPELLRPAAAMQAIVAVRAARGAAGSRRDRRHRPVA
jgi:phosphatidylglycerophosphate synthase